jgi:drug/metabolite transporter (DMT)-like permease
MTWLILSILTAFFESLKDVFCKKSLQALDSNLVACVTMAIAALILLPGLWIVGIPTLGPDFWTAIGIGGTLNVVAYSLYVKAIQISDLSLITPLSALTPLFLLVTSPLIVKEIPTMWDGVGVFLVVMGSYILNLQSQDADYFAPLKAMVTNKGSRMMIVVAFIWSITSTFDKIGVQNSSPLFWAIALFSYIAIGILPSVLWGRRSEKHSGKRSEKQRLLPMLRQTWKLLLFAGIANGIAVGSQMVAVGIAPVTQVIAVKRMSALFSVGFGVWIFGEKGWRERILGAGVMVLGVVVMAIG